MKEHYHRDYKRKRRADAEKGITPAQRKLLNAELAIEQAQASMTPDELAAYTRVKHGLTPARLSNTPQEKTPEYMRISSGEYDPFASPETRERWPALVTDPKYATRQKPQFDMGGVITGSFHMRTHRQVWCIKHGFFIEREAESHARILILKPAKFRNDASVITYLQKMLFALTPKSIDYEHANRVLAFIKQQDEYAIKGAWEPGVGHFTLNMHNLFSAKPNKRASRSAIINAAYEARIGPAPRRGMTVGALPTKYDPLWSEEQVKLKKRQDANRIRMWNKRHKTARDLILSNPNTVAAIDKRWREGEKSFKEFLDKIGDCK